MTVRQCSSCGGFCKRSGCERENVKRAAELRHLHSVNAQLLEALDYFIQCVEQSAHFDARIGFMGGAFDKARAAIAAAKEKV